MPTTEAWFQRQPCRYQPAGDARDNPALKRPIHQIGRRDGSSEYGDMGLPGAPRIVAAHFEAVADSAPKVSGCHGTVRKSDSN